jgi:hypothetical protein
MKQDVSTISLPCTFLKNDANSMPHIAIPSFHKPRDATEIQDLYRCTLAASWARLPTELPADECIEEIFSGGNGWRSHSSNSDSEEDGDSSGGGVGTLRPSDFRRLQSQQKSSNQRHHHHHHHHHQHHHHQQQQHSYRQVFSRHRRSNSGSSDRSVSTVTGRPGAEPPGAARGRNGRLRDNTADDEINAGLANSIASLSPSLGTGSSGSGDDAASRRAREVAEHHAREDLIAWRLPGGGLVT